jgi:hypothetical protein
VADTPDLRIAQANTAIRDLLRANPDADPREYQQLLGEGGDAVKQRDEDGRGVLAA